MEVFVKFMKESRRRRHVKRFISLVFQRQLQLSKVRISRVVRKRRLFSKSKSQDSFNPIPPWWENKTGETRNWLDLPEDITLHMLNKVGIVDVLRNTQMVCSEWRDLSQDPCLSTKILIPKPSQYFIDYKQFYNFMMKFVDKIYGQLIEFCTFRYMGFRLLQTVSLHGHSLKYLKVDGNSYAYLRFIGKSFTQLEHLYLGEVLQDYSLLKTIQQIGPSCPNLKHLQLHAFSDYIEYESCVNNVAFSIAKYAPRLHTLRLTKNAIDNKGLQAILEGCPELEYIGLRKCPSINIRDTDWLLHCSVLRNKIIDARVYNEAKGNFECYLWSNN